MVKNRIADVLSEQNKSIYWLAQETKVTYKTMHKIVNNKTESIRFETLEGICILQEQFLQLVQSKS